MRKTLLATVLVLAASDASAQGVGVGVGVSNSQAASASAANNALQFNTPSDQTVRNTPSVSAPGFSSGHPCGLAHSVGIAVLGTGLSGGTTQVDEACLLAQMGETAAATYMIAARSGAACRALEAAGKVVCSGSGNASASTRNQPQTATVADVVSCVQREDGTIVARGQLGRYGITAEQATAYCAR